MAERRLSAKCTGCRVQWVKYAASSAARERLSSSSFSSFLLSSHLHTCGDATLQKTHQWIIAAACRHPLQSRIAGAAWRLLKHQCTTAEHVGNGHWALSVTGCSSTLGQNGGQHDDLYQRPWPLPASARRLHMSCFWHAKNSTSAKGQSRWLSGATAGEASCLSFGNCCNVIQNTKDLHDNWEPLVCPGSLATNSSSDGAQDAILKACMPGYMSRMRLKTVRAQTAIAYQLSEIISPSKPVHMNGLTARDCANVHVLLTSPS